MGTVGGWRWERLLLVAVLVLGVLAMHAIPAISGVAPANDSTSKSMSKSMSESMSISMLMPAPVAAGAAGPVAHDLPGPAQPSGDQPGHGPDSALHHVLAVCLAILAGGVLLVAAAAVFGALHRRVGDGTRARVVPTVVAVAARPPPAHAVRLAQLCVLRN